ncbi:unnamed protein product [marine sediment metagenome]|uniref:Uncharacterized protein n=1 Tax=marine sediment metagenome TaxID=412755 RepID=X1JUA3_9ZZZZ
MFTPKEITEAYKLYFGFPLPAKSVQIISATLTLIIPGSKINKGITDGKNTSPK